MLAKQPAILTPEPDLWQVKAFGAVNVSLACQVGAAVFRLGNLQQLPIGYFGCIHNV
jgi:hypothetical protein